MRSPPSHRWNLTPKDAAQLQQQLRGLVRCENDLGDIRRVAGADIALDPAGDRGFAGVIVYSFPHLEEVERRWVKGRLAFPYVPGLLSFREGPLLLEAFSRLRTPPDLILFDGQGIAHPRRFGLASHLALLLDVPGIGVAKSRLCGTHREPGRRAGSWTRLRAGKEAIGAVLRTRDGVRPVFVSPGHRIDVRMAVELTLACCDGYRIPRPTREADRWVAELKRRS